MRRATAPAPAPLLTRRASSVARAVLRFVEGGADRCREPVRRQVRERDGGRSGPQVVDTLGPEGLICDDRDGDGRYAGAEPCGGGARPGVVDDGGPPREQPLVRHIADLEHVVALNRHLGPS